MDGADGKKAEEEAEKSKEIVINSIVSVRTVFDSIIVDLKKASQDMDEKEKQRQECQKKLLWFKTFQAELRNVLEL